MFRTNDLEKVLKEVLPYAENILISGAPGIGKSEIIYQVAKKLDMSVYEIRLYEQGDAAVGYPKVSSITSFTKPFWFKEIEERRPDIVLFDDFHLVDSSIQKFLYRMLTSRRIHNYGLSYNPKIIFAGNFNLDSAGACEVQSPVMSRFDIAIHFEPEPERFINWGFESGRIDERVLAFIKANPDLLYTPDPPTTKMYPCPRAWEKLSKVLKATDNPNFATGIVGEEAGAKFIDFWPLLAMKPEEILARDPENLTFSERVAAIYVIANPLIADDLVRGVQTERLTKTLEWVDKLDPDFAFLFFRILKNKAFKDDREKVTRMVKNLCKIDESTFRKVTKIAASLVEGTVDEKRIEEIVEDNVMGAKA